MKILIVSNLFPPIVFGGYEILCKQVVEVLRTRGHEVEILTSDFRAEDANEESNIHRTMKLTTDFPRPGERVSKVDFSLRGQDRVGRYNAKKLRDVALDFRPDVVFCWCLNRLGAGVILEAQKLGIPVHYTINDEHPRQFRYTTSPRSLRQYARSVAERFFGASTFRKASTVKMTVISKALKGNLLALQAPVEDAEVFYQGVDLNKFTFQPASRTSGEPLRLLYVGQLSKVKGVHTLIKAAANLNFPFQLDIVGAGVPDYEQELKQLADDLGISQQVNFRGKLSREDVIKAYREHHILVFSSEWDEPFGLTHLEAMASGCAVISTTTGGSAELIVNGQNALAYQAGDASQLAGCLSKLERHECIRRALVMGGRTYVEEHHSLRRYVLKLESWLKAG